MSSFNSSEQSSSSHRSDENSSSGSSNTTSPLIEKTTMPYATLHKRTLHLHNPYSIEREVTFFHLDGTHVVKHTVPLNKNSIYINGIPSDVYVVQVEYSISIVHFR